MSAVHDDEDDVDLDPFVGYAIYDDGPGRYVVLYYTGEYGPPSACWRIRDAIYRCVAGTTTLDAAVAAIRLMGAIEARDMTVGNNWDHWAVLRPLKEIGAPR